MTPRSSLRSWRLALLIVAGVIVAGMMYVDRPVAEYVHRALEGTRLATWAMRLLPSLPALLVGAVLLALGVAGIGGNDKARDSWLRTLWLGLAGMALATTAGATAFVTVWWLRAPGSRFVGALLSATVPTAIVVTNGHWVTDVIGGGFLGAFVGSVVVQAMRHRWPVEAHEPRAG